MVRVRMLLAMAFAILAVGALTATTASAALPTLLFLSTGGEGELKGVQEGKEECVFNSALISLAAEFCLFQFHGTDMSSLGPAQILFEKVTIKGSATECHTEGDKADTVLIDNAEWHLVLSLTAQYPVGALVLIPEFVLHCANGLNIKIRGSVLAKLSPFGKDVESFTAETLCEGTGNRTPTFSEYDTDTGMGTAKLEANGGLGFQAACELVALPTTVTATQMVEIMEP